MDLQYYVYGILQRDIYGMGAFPTAPAHMVPNPVLRNASEGVIEGINTQLSLLAVLFKGEVGAGPGMRDVPAADHPRVVYLQDEPRVHDGPVLLAHRRGQREEEFLFRLVMRLEVCLTETEAGH